jgi:hypothetical protein
MEPKVVLPKPILMNHHHWHYFLCIRQWNEKYFPYKFNIYNAIFLHITYLCLCILQLFDLMWNVHSLKKKHVFQFHLNTIYAENIFHYWLRFTILYLKYLSFTKVVASNSIERSNSSTLHYIRLWIYIYIYNF